MLATTCFIYSCVCDCDCVASAKQALSRQSLKLEEICGEICDTSSLKILFIRISLSHVLDRVHRVENLTVFMRWRIVFDHYQP